MKEWLLWGYDDGQIWCCELGPSVYRPLRDFWRWHRGDRYGKSKIVRAINEMHARIQWGFAQ